MATISKNVHIEIEYVKKRENKSDMVLPIKNKVFIQISSYFEKNLKMLLFCMCYIYRLIKQKVLDLLAYQFSVLIRGVHIW